MIVAELIKELEQMPQEAEVHYAYNYKDYWRTEVAPPVNNVELGKVIHDIYHNMPKTVLEDEMFVINLGNDAKDIPDVVLLKA